MSLTTFEDDDVDREEETPFLKSEIDDPDSDAVPRKRPTPLPKRQISILLTLWVAESIMEHSISPYINQVRYTKTGGTGRFRRAPVLKPHHYDSVGSGPPNSERR